MIIERLRLSRPLTSNMIYRGQDVILSNSYTTILMFYY
jgi:hypothetical protein